MTEIQQLPVEEVDTSTPLEEIEPKMRLGTLVRRYRIAARKTTAEVAEHLCVLETMVVDLERGMVSMQAEQLQSLAAFLGVLFEPFLYAARDWNRAVFADSGTEVVKLTDMEITERALKGGEELLERALIQAADDLAFLANVLREAAVRAGQSWRTARALLAERGVPVPKVDPSQTVYCSGPKHEDELCELEVGFDQVFTMNRGMGPDGKPLPKVYFCSSECAEAYGGVRLEE